MRAVITSGPRIGDIVDVEHPDADLAHVVCDGAAVPRETFPELFEAIGETYGKGDGSTTFNLPDLRSALDGR